MALDVEYYKQLNYDFHKKVGSLGWYEDLEAIGITPRDAVGTFGSSDTTMLLKFCKDNPQYHIITRLSAAKTVNKFVNGNYIYTLAAGDRNPNLELNFPPEVVDHLMSDIMALIQRVKPEVGL